MKYQALFLLLLASSGCDPYRFGFKNNPAYVLDTAFKAITNLDKKSFLEVSGQEALCLYGNETGVAYLKSNFTLDTSNVKLAPKFVSSTYFRNPEYVGYWSYYSERYIVDVSELTSNRLVLQVVVDCNYGTDGEKDVRYLNLKPKKYKTKDCRLVKIIPKDFPGLDASQCGILQVEL